MWQGRSESAVMEVMKVMKVMKVRSASYGIFIDLTQAAKERCDGSM